MSYGKITPKQQEILEFIKESILNRGYPPAVREICEAVHLKSTSSVHSHLETMEKNGYIERVPVEYDARLKKIVVLPKGLEASAAVDEDIRYVESKLQDGLTEEELEIFRRAAKKMLRNLQQSRGLSNGRS